MSSGSPQAASRQHLRGQEQAQAHSPAMALQALADSVRALRSSALTPGVSLDMKLSDVRTTVNALVPILSMPLWLPFSFMLSILSYFVAIVSQVMDASSEPASTPWSLQQRSDGTYKMPRLGSSTSLNLSTVGASSAGSSSILRALDQILELVTGLPGSSPKYTFTRSLAEQLLMDNTAQKPPLLELNRVALSKAFRRTVDQLEACLIKGSNGGWGSLLRKCSQAAGWASSLNAGAALEVGGNASAAAIIRSEKLSQELLWLADKLFHYGGGAEVLRLWSSAPGLADAARSSAPRVQANLVKLSALLVRSMAGTEWTVTAVISRESLNGPIVQTMPFSLASDPALSYRPSGSPASIPTVPVPPLATQSWAPPDLQYRLLLLWLPLMCRGTSIAGDGPILSSIEKQVRCAPYYTKGGTS